MLSKRYESTEVDRRTWLHVPSGSHWSTSKLTLVEFNIRMHVIMTTTISFFWLLVVTVRTWNLTFPQVGENRATSFIIPHTCMYFYTLFTILGLFCFIFIVMISWFAMTVGLVPVDCVTYFRNLHVRVLCYNFALRRFQKCGPNTI